MRDDFPPRGSGDEGDTGTVPSEFWGHPEQLAPDTWNWTPGKFLVGRTKDHRNKERLIGLQDDRHIIMVAGTGAGKTRTVLGPNLRRYPGSAVVLDPKGELYAKTADARRAMGHEVYYLDPFGVTGKPSHAFNPFAELRGDAGKKADHVVSADMAQLADAVIIETGGDKHWTNAAKNLLCSTALYLLETSSVPTMAALRALLNADLARLEQLFREMAGSDAFGGIVRNSGSAFLGKLAGSEKELQGILSTAQEQTARFDDLTHIMDRSDFRLADLKRRPITIYLILPATRMATHFRWLRMFIELTIAAMEAEPTQDGSLPVWLVLEEFATLGHMRSLETAAGFIRGMNCQLVSVLQDLAQLKALYPNSWETFIGNAGLLLAFGNSDLTTTEHLSKMIGETVVMETEKTHVSSSSLAHGDLGGRERPRSVPLLAPFEMRRYFARTTGRVLVMSPDRPPIYVDRFVEGETGP